MSKTKNLKRYIIRKWVMAESAEAAIKADKKAPVDAVFLDDDWLQEETKQLGFNGKSN